MTGTLVVNDNDLHAPILDVDLNADVVEADLFKYFLNDDLSTDVEIDGSPSSVESFSPQESPQASPPQLTPDSPELITPPLNFGIMSNSYGNSVDSCLSVSAPICIKEEPITSSAPLHPQASSPSRKRERSDSLNLSRDELLRLSSKGLETYAQSVASSRPLTVEEERQLKRQRRLIKNRESAQLSRLRKKIYIEELERKVSHLTAENENLTKQLALLATDKKKLHDEVLYLQTVIKGQTTSFPSSTNGAVSKKSTRNSTKVVTHMDE